MFSIDSQNHSDTSSQDWTHDIPNLFQPEDHELQLQWVEAALRYINDAVILTDDSGAVLLLNPLAEKMTGWESQDAKFLPISKVFPVTHPFGEEIVLQSIEIIDQQDSIQDIPSNFKPALLRNQDNTYFLSIEYTVTSIRNHNGECIGISIVFREIAQACYLNRHTSWQINHDFLTGLMNRPFFENCLAQAVSNASALETNHALCYLNFDHFKIINETLDYTAGDEFLRQISFVLQQRIRKTDVLARLGGDEFGLILYQCSLEQSLNVLQTICAEIQSFKFISRERTFSFSVSAGMTMLSAKSMSPSRMLIAAKSACEIAKNQGRNRIHIYQPDDQEILVSQESMQWIPRLYQAIENNEFCLYFQPIIPVDFKIDPQHQKFQSSFEILLRLQDNLGKVISPAHFIPVAERYGLMHLLDRWVIRNLFQYLHHRKAESAEPEQNGSNGSLYMINLSGASLNDDQFLAFVKSQFTNYAISPQMICFEITETMAIANLSKAINLIQQIKALGCYFALDDFGSGMSSLGYLKHLPIDFLKIDGVFIKDIEQNPVDCEIVEAINRMAHAMGIETIAEFVENSAILTKLKTLGINYAQGYGIAKPALLC